MLRPIVQPELVFGTDTALAVPEGFANAGLDGLCGAKQMTDNRFPCCFLPKRAKLAPGGSVQILSLYGQTEDRARVAKLADSIPSPAWFDAKRREAAELVDGLCAPIDTHTADPVFDAYCKQTYLDNVLRGLPCDDGGGGVRGGVRCVPGGVFSAE